MLLAAAAVMRLLVPLPMLLLLPIMLVVLPVVPILPILLLPITSILPAMPIMLLPIMPSMPIMPIMLAPVDGDGPARIERLHPPPPHEAVLEQRERRLAPLALALPGHINAVRPATAACQTAA